MSIDFQDERKEQLPQIFQNGELDRLNAELDRKESEIDHTLTLANSMVATEVSTKLAAAVQKAASEAAAKGTSIMKNLNVEGIRQNVANEIIDHIAAEVAPDHLPEETRAQIEAELFVKADLNTNGSIHAGPGNQTKQGNRADPESSTNYPGESPQNTPGSERPIHERINNPAPDVLSENIPRSERKVV